MPTTHELIEELKRDSSLTDQIIRNLEISLGMAQKDNHKIRLISKSMERYRKLSEKVLEGLLNVLAFTNIYVYRKNQKLKRHKRRERCQ